MDYFVFTVTASGVSGFTVSWFWTGASLVFPPLLISVLLLRNLTQQLLKKTLKRMRILNDDEITKE